MNYPAQQYPQQFPPQPQQPVYPQAPPAQYQQPVYPQAPPVQQGYGAPAPQGYQAPQAPPLAEGSLDAFYSQPSVGGGPSISWTDKMKQPKPVGTSYTGIVARDVTNADVQQQTDFNTRQPKFYRDGRPMFAMKVPLVVQPSEEFPDGEAAWYVKGQARDELTRAMAEAGVQGAPKAGATITVQLVQRKPNNNGMNPSNIVRVTYVPAGGQQGTGAPSPAPVQQQMAPQPAQQEVYNGPPQGQAPQQYAQGGYVQAPAPQQAPAQPAPQGQQLPPPGVQMDPDKAALLARLTQGQG